MKQKRITNRNVYKSVVWPTAVLSMGLSMPVFAQSQSSAVVEEIIVSARRQEESSQDIPIAITVVDQATMSNNNVFSAVDLKQFTPSLSVNTRFGPDQASFAIRGFTQELRTTASVGFYFAEVVAPRGGGSVTAGDGAGPGAFFDLQNVLVLKGPQGTLFGRNTTGGAILLTPQEPTNQFEGYLEGSAGDYDMQRIQGVVNVPMGDNLRARFGVDTMQRDGYLNNLSGIGPSELGDTDYISARASVIWDITDNLENYTIVSYTDSENNGTVTSLFACGPAGAASWYNPINAGDTTGQCDQQLATQAGDFYAVHSRMPNPTSKLEQWQVINKTSWSINDDLTFRNIISYADLEQVNRTDVYGINYAYPGTNGTGRYGFTESNQIPGGIPTNSQVSFVEEMQLQGYAMDGDLTWQAGLYFENSLPDGTSGSQSINQLYCPVVDVNDPSNSQCASIGGGLGRAGGISRTAGEIEYITNAAYTEMTYDLTDQWKLTGGLRYTRDKVIGKITDARIWTAFPNMPATPATAGNNRCSYGGSINPGPNDCKDEVDQTSEAVTGLIDLDYFLTQDVMFYAKYSRGYRMGSINLFGGDPYRSYNPESVDAYEIGSKTTFGGPVPGTFNISAFYNELSGQQIQIGYVPLDGRTPTTGIDNADLSVIQGVEVETTLMLLEDLVLTLSYTYLDTQLKEIAPLLGTQLRPGLNIFTAPDGSSAILSSSSAQNEHLSFSPRHSAVVGLNWRLPLPAEIGDVSIGGTYSYVDEQMSTSPGSTPYAWLPSYEVTNLNANWNGIFGTGFDAGVFVTNAFDEEYTAYVPGNYNSVGIEMRSVGVPKMWGAKVRYNF